MAFADALAADCVALRYGDPNIGAASIPGTLLSAVRVG